MARLLWDNEEAALEEFQKAIALEPDWDHPRLWLASFLYDHGKVDESIAELEVILDRDPENNTALNNLCGNLAFSGRYEEALPHLHKAICLYPEDAAFRLMLGYVYYHLERYDESAAEYEEACRLEPTWPFAHNDLGWAYLKLEEYEKAREQFEKAKELSGPGEDAYEEAEENLEKLKSLMDEGSRDAAPHEFANLRSNSQDNPFPLR